MLTDKMIAELKDIAKRNGGDVPVDEVVAKARDPSSALHSHSAFEWDLEKAAMSSWRQSARVVVQAYVTIIDRGDGERVPMRALVSLPVEGSERVYEPTPRVLRENRGRLIESILDRLTSIISSYPVVELDPIVRAIEKVREEISSPPPRRRRARDQDRERRTSAA